MSLRRAEPSDAPALSEIAKAAKAHWGYPPAWLEAWEDELTLSPSYVSANAVFAAEDSGRLLGLVSLERQSEYSEIAHLWVRPDCMGHGVGAALVAQALREAATRPGHAIRVISDPNAATFYERLGARRIGAQPAPMPGAPDRLLPILEFPAPGQTIA
ncbi:MAG: GNAT family N-acetyltransferase [Gemmatimonadaceae bacterium]|nr:GNAT family N-acetyltransferase [Gemmatimonadaceae bacterium]